MPDYAVLFVCTGNICRSPTAEGVFRHRIKELGLEDRIITDSAGTHGYHTGEPPDSRSIRAARARGIILDDLRARQFESRDFHDFDLILAMDNGHMRTLRAAIPAQARATLALFMDFAPHTGYSDVPDPYYGEASGFETVLDLVGHGVEGLMDYIRREHLEKAAPGGGF